MVNEQLETCALVCRCNRIFKDIFNISMFELCIHFIKEINCSKDKFNTQLI